MLNFLPYIFGLWVYVKVSVSDIESVFTDKNQFPRRLCWIPFTVPFKSSVVVCSAHSFVAQVILESHLSENFRKVTEKHNAFTFPVIDTRLVGGSAQTL